MTQHTLFEIYSESAFPEYKHNRKYFQLEPPKCRVDPHQGTVHLPAQDGRDMTPVPEIQPLPFLRVEVRDRPRLPSSGWVLGSDSAVCDIVIGRHEEGISGRQFCVSPERDSGRLIIQNLSRYGTFVEEVTEGQIDYVRTRAQRGISDTQSLVIMAGERTRLEITLPGEQGKSFDTRWAELYADLNREGPTLETLTIVPAPASTHVSPYFLQTLIAERPTYMLYSAVEKENRCRVAIKQYSKQYLTKHPGSADGEARLLSRIQHVRTHVSRTTQIPCLLY